MAETNGARTFEQDHQHLGNNETEGSALNKIRTAGSISISPELFEKIYLSPQNKVKGDIRQTFGNPTPIAIGGFLLALSPLSNELLGWRGSGGLGAATVGNYWFFGGLLMVLGGFLEFILGNTFPSVVFTTFGAFWLSFAATLTPYFNATTAYGTKGAEDPTFAASFAFFLLYMGVLCVVFFICALRTNLVFVLIFALLIPAFGCLAAAFWKIAEGDAIATKLQHVGAGLAYGVCILGWYLFTVQMLASVDFPISLPVGDLSRLIPGASDTQRRKLESTHDENGGDAYGGGEQKSGIRKYLPG